jgi:hypothetical protein
MAGECQRLLYLVSGECQRLLYLVPGECQRLLHLVPGECQRLLYLVTTKDSPSQVPGEGGMAGECQRMVYLVPTKDGTSQVPGKGSMAGEYLGQPVEEGLHLSPAQDGRVRHVQVHLKNPKGNSVKFFIYRRPTLYPLEIAVDFLKSL